MESTYRTSSESGDYRKSSSLLHMSQGNQRKSSENLSRGQCRSSNEDFYYPTGEAVGLPARSFENIWPRPEDPSRKPYSLRNRTFYHSAEKITAMSSSSSVHSLPNTDISHSRVGTKRFVSFEDVFTPEDPSRELYSLRNGEFYHSAEKMTVLSSSCSVLSLPNIDTNHSRLGTKTLSVSFEVVFTPENPSLGQHKSRNETFSYTKQGARGLSVSLVNILPRPESPSRASCGSQNEVFDRSAKRTKEFSSSIAQRSDQPDIVNGKKIEDAIQRRRKATFPAYGDKEKIQKKCKSCGDVSTTAQNNMEENNDLTRLSKLLVEKGEKALRNTLDAIHPPAHLPRCLNSNRLLLEDLKLTYKVISEAQWNLLFPLSGSPPDSKTFDVILLSILLHKICGSASPEELLDTDRSQQANVRRITLFKNEIYTYVISNRPIRKATFENVWESISRALVDLNVPQEEIDDLKNCRLSTEDENYYVDRLKQWFLKAEKCNKLHVEKSLEHLPQPTDKRHTSKKGKRASSSKIKANEFFANFVCDHLAKHTKARKLVTLKEDRQRFVLRFNDINQINSIYCDFKNENKGMFTGILNVFKRKSKKRKDKLKNLMAVFEEEGSMKIVGSGTEYDKEYLKYEIKDSELWNSLTNNFAVQKSLRKKDENSSKSNVDDGQSREPSSDASDTTSSHKPQEKRNLSAATPVNVCESCKRKTRQMHDSERDKWPINKIEYGCFEEICKLLDLATRSKKPLMSALGGFSQTDVAHIETKYEGKGGVGIAKEVLGKWGSSRKENNVGVFKKILSDMQRIDVVSVIETWENMSVCHGCGATLINTRMTAQGRDPKLISGRNLKSIS